MRSEAFFILAVVSGYWILKKPVTGLFGALNCYCLALAVSTQEFLLLAASWVVGVWTAIHRARFAVWIESGQLYRIGSRPCFA